MLVLPHRSLVPLIAAALLGGCASTAPQEEPTPGPAAEGPAPTEALSDIWVPTEASVAERLAALADLPPYGDDDASRKQAVDARMKWATKKVKPEWVDKSLWHAQDSSGIEMIFAVGLVDNVDDPFLRFVTAENRARAEVVRSRGQQVSRWLRPNGDMVQTTEIEGGTSARIVDWYANGKQLAVLAVETSPPPPNAEGCTRDDAEACKALGLTFVGVTRTATRPYQSNAALCADGKGWACNGVAWEACFGHGDCSESVLATATKAVKLLEEANSPKLAAAVDTLGWVECLRNNDPAAMAAWKRACDGGVKSACELKCATAREGHTTYAVACGKGDVGACASLANDACAGGSDCSDPVLQAAQRAAELSKDPRLIDLTAYVHCRRGEIDRAAAAWKKACEAGVGGVCEMSCREQ